MQSQMQRLLRPQFDVEGRTKIEELEKYIKDVIQQRKKIIATCILVIDAANAGPGSGYEKFCEEFAKDRRVGISNITKTGSVNFYTIPPVLKKDISILSSFPDEDATTTVLYGVIIAKDLEISKMIVAVPSIAPMSQQTGVPSAPSQGLLGEYFNAIRFLSFPFLRFSILTIHSIVFLTQNRRRMPKRFRLLFTLQYNQ